MPSPGANEYSIGTFSVGAYGSGGWVQGRLGPVTVLSSEPLGVVVDDPEFVGRQVDIPQSHPMDDADFVIKTGDTSPALHACLRDGYEPIDLSGSTTIFKMEHIETGTAVRGLCTYEDTTAGRLSYRWESGDTSEPGMYHAEFGIDYSGPTDIANVDVDETFPPDGWLRVHVRDSL